MDQMTRLEEKLAHALRQCEELSDVVADQATRIDRLERRLAQMAEMLRDSADGSSHSFVDQPPPHY